MASKAMKIRVFSYPIVVWCPLSKKSCDYRHKPYISRNWSHWATSSLHLQIFIVGTQHCANILTGKTSTGTFSLVVYVDNIELLKLKLNKFWDDQRASWTTTVVGLVTHNIREGICRECHCQGRSRGQGQRCRISYKNTVHERLRSNIKFNKLIQQLQCNFHRILAYQATIFYQRRT